MPVKVHLPDGRVVNFPDGMPPDQIQAEVSKLAQPVDDSPSVMSERTWTDRAVDALPTIGGMAGGLIGGKMPIVGTALAGVGGAGGEAFKQVANAVRGRMDLVPGSIPEQLSAIGASGATQAAAEGGGRLISNGLQAVAAPIYNFGLGASKGLRREYPGMTEAALTKGIAVSGRGTDKARALRSASAGQADSAIAAAERAGAPPVNTNTIVRAGGFQDVAKSARNRAALGMADDTGDVAARAKALHINHPKGVPLTRAQELKRTAQQSADSAFRTQERGGVIRTVDAELDKATATGLKRGIEQAVPAVTPINQQTQALSGLTRGLEDAEQRNHILSRLIVPTAAGVSAGFGTGDVGTGLGSALTTAALTSPGNLSRGAIGLFGAGKHNVPAHLIRAAILAQLESKE